MNKEFEEAINNAIKDFDVLKAHKILCARDKLDYEIEDVRDTIDGLVYRASGRDDKNGFALHSFIGITLFYIPKSINGVAFAQFSIDCK